MRLPAVLSNCYERIMPNSVHRDPSASDLQHDGRDRIAMRMRIILPHCNHTPCYSASSPGVAAAHGCVDSEDWGTAGSAPLEHMPPSSTVNTRGPHAYRPQGS